MSGLNFCLFLERVAMCYQRLFNLTPVTLSGTRADLTDSVSLKLPELTGGKHSVSGTE